MMMMKKVQITNFKYKSRWSERDWKSKAKSSEQKKLKQKSKYWFKGEKGPFMCLRWILPSRKKNILKIIKQQKNTKQKENTEKISTLVDPSWLYCASIWISFSPSLIPLLLMLFFPYSSVDAFVWMLVLLLERAFLVPSTNAIWTRQWCSSIFNSI